MELPDERNNAPPGAAEHPCAVCGVEAPWEIWGQRVCPPCASSYPEKEIHEGVQECTPLEHVAMGASWRDCAVCKAFCAELKRRTKAWVDAARSLRKAEKSKPIPQGAYQ